MKSRPPDVRFSVEETQPPGVEATVLFITQGAKAADGAAAGAALADGGEDFARSAARLLTSGVSTGKAREVFFDILDRGETYRRLYLAGLGPREKITPETLRQSGAAALRALRRHKITSALFVPPSLSGFDAAAVAEHLTTGALLAGFCFDQYKGSVYKAKQEEDEDRPTTVWVLAAGEASKARAGVERAHHIAQAQNFARTIASRPGNDINPPVLAQVVQAMAKEVGLTCTVMDEKRLAELKMGGLLGVGSGAIHSPPRLIVLEYSPQAPGAKRKTPSRRAGDSSHPLQTLLVVGKAITFDTGGISIKPADKMGKMIFDKCGGMAVIGLMHALAHLKPDVRVIGILASAENAISSLAYRPGDILTLYNGVTVEITNTDAEGRLVLGDALAWGIETYKPVAVLDLATLTGGVITALGRTTAGVMTNNDALFAQLSQAAESAGEKIWRLPLWEEHREQIKSDTADIVNSAGREAHPLQGGAFLSYFVPTDGSVPWAHLDIAGVSDTEKELPCYGKGATGWGVRTLVNWVQARAAEPA